MYSALNRYYGISVIGRSLRHFLIGKGFKVFSSLTILILLARLLGKDEYAVYISFQAIVGLAGLLGSVGIQPVLFRYLPELRASENNLMMYRLLWSGVLLRNLVVCIIFLAATYHLPFIAGIFNLEQWLWLIKPYFIIGILHISVLTLSQSFESLLWQKEAQYTLAAGSMLKLFAILIAMMMGKLNLTTLVVIEGLCEFLMLTLLCIGGYRRWQVDIERCIGDLGWFRKNFRRVMRYGIFGCLVRQTGVLYGSSPNRLLTAHYMPANEVALLGVADSIVRLVRRFMPTRMLLGLVRPIFMARYSSDGDFSTLSRMSNLVYRLNLAILLLPIILLFVVGVPAFDWMTAGKYGMAAHLLAGFLCLMVMEGMRILLELMVQAVEKNHIFLISNLVQSLSLLLAIPLLAVVGLWGLVIANMVGTILANIIIVLWLRRFGYIFNLDRKLNLQILVYALISGLIGWWCLIKFDSYIIAAGVICLVYGILIIVRAPVYPEEKNQILRLLKNTFKNSE